MSKGTREDELAETKARLGALEEALIEKGVFPTAYKYEPPKRESSAKPEIPPQWRGDPDAPVPPLMSDEKLERMFAEQQTRREEAAAARQAAAAKKHNPNDGVIGLVPDKDEPPPQATPKAQSPIDIINEKFKEAFGDNFISVTEKDIKGQKAYRIAFKLDLPTEGFGQKLIELGFNARKGFDEAIISPLAAEISEDGKEKRIILKQAKVHHALGISTQQGVRR